MQSRTPNSHYNFEYWKYVCCWTSSKYTGPWWWLFIFQVYNFYFFSSEEPAYTVPIPCPLKSEHRLNKVGNAITTTGKFHGHSESQIHEERDFGSSETQ